MRLPRDVSGDDLARRLTTDRPEQHHVTIPRHAALRIGTLAAIPSEVEAHHHVTRDALLDMLFG